MFRTHISYFTYNVSSCLVRTYVKFEAPVPPIPSLNPALLLVFSSTGDFHIPQYDCGALHCMVDSPVAPVAFRLMIFSPPLDFLLGLLAVTRSLRLSRPQISTLGVATGFYHGISLWRFVLISALTLPPVSLPPQAFVASYWGASSRVAGADSLRGWRQLC